MNSRLFAKSILSSVLAAVLLVPLSAGASAASAGTKHYRITNPYQTVDWGTWKHYKANLHTHSTVSDGYVDFKDMIEAHYAQGFDILAMTDHGAVNRGWNVQPQTVPLLSFNAILKKPKCLTVERYKEITAGSDRGGRGMTDVPFGIEQNAGTLTKTHVNSFFADYGQGKWGKENDFEGPIAAVDALGGLSHVNHPGDWLESKTDINIAKDPKNIKFFAGLFKKYPSCLGLEIPFTDTSGTRYDRVLWDGLLESVIPAGRNVWAFSNSDAHELKDIGYAFEIFMMPENTAAGVRTAMENGTFFACGRYKLPAPEDYLTETGAYPEVDNITVDEAAGKITVQGTAYDKIEWVAKGEVIAEGNTIDLYAHADQIGHYVRAQLYGPGGVCFTQAFALDDGSVPPPEPPENFFVKLWDNCIFALKSTRFYVIINELVKELSK